MTLYDFERQVLEQIDHQVATASADELFAGGYLRGHISLAVAQCESRDSLSIAALCQGVETSLSQACAAGELVAADEALVRQMWQQLQRVAR